MLRRIVLSLTLTVLALSASAIGFADGVRIHCEKDTVIINEALSAFKGKRYDSRAALSCDVADFFVGTPYVGGSLEGQPEQLTIRLDGVDCVTYVENVLALTKALDSSNPTWRGFAEALENIRYRKGVMDGYPSRLHYMSDWISENIYRGNIKEITEDIPGATFSRMTLDYMTRHPEAYEALKDPKILEDIKMMEMGFRAQKVPFLKKETIGKKEVVSELRDGDILVVVPNEAGLDASHVGFIRMKNGVAYLLHASSDGGKVMLEVQPLSYYFTHKGRKSKGYRLLRIAE